jgi:hypothetical protein
MYVFQRFVSSDSNMLYFILAWHDSSYIYINMISKLWERLESMKRDRRSQDQAIAYEHALDLYFYLLENYEAIRESGKLSSFFKVIETYIF